LTQQIGIVIPTHKIEHHHHPTYLTFARKTKMKRDQTKTGTPMNQYKVFTVPFVGSIAIPETTV
jgi:hypothetical protein